MRLLQNAFPHDARVATQDEIGFNVAGLSLLRKDIDQSGVNGFADAAREGGSSAAGRPTKKKRRRNG